MLGLYDVILMGNGKQGICVDIMFRIVIRGLVQIGRVLEFVYFSYASPFCLGRILALNK